FVNVGVLRSVHDTLAYSHQGIRLIGINRQNLFADLLHLRAVIALLIGGYVGFVQQNAQLAVGKLCREVVGGLFQVRGIARGSFCRVECVVFRLGFRLRRSFSLRRGCTCRRSRLSRCRTRRLRPLARVAGLCCPTANDTNASATTTILARFILSPWDLQFSALTLLVSTAN